MPEELFLLKTSLSGMTGGMAAGTILKESELPGDKQRLLDAHFIEPYEAPEDEKPKKSSNRETATRAAPETAAMPEAEAPTAPATEEASLALDDEAPDPS